MSCVQKNNEKDKEKKELSNTDRYNISNRFHYSENATLGLLIQSNWVQTQSQINTEVLASIIGGTSGTSGTGGFVGSTDYDQNLTVPPRFAAQASSPGKTSASDTRVPTNEVTTTIVTFEETDVKRTQGTSLFLKLIDIFGTIAFATIPESANTNPLSNPLRPNPKSRLDSVLRPCFASWSKISTPNGLVEIKDIKIGDEVFAFDWFGNVFVSNVMEKTHHPEKTEVFNYELSNGLNIFITDNHAVLTNENKFVEIGSLNIGDWLVLENGEKSSIISKQSIGHHQTYNILTEQIGTYIADGIRVWGSDWFTEWSDVWGNYEHKKIKETHET